MDERTQEAAMINKALGIKAPKGAATAATLDAARAAYIRLLGSPGSNAEIKAEVTCFCEQLDQMQLRMLGPKPRKRPTTSYASTYTVRHARWEVSGWLSGIFGQPQAIGQQSGRTYVFEPDVCADFPR